MVAAVEALGAPGDAQHGLFPGPWVSLQPGLDGLALGLADRGDLGDHGQDRVDLWLCRGAGSGGRLWPRGAGLGSVRQVAGPDLVEYEGTDMHADLPT